MSLNQPHSKKVSYQEYLSWPEEPRYEIINGIPFLHAAPVRQHQQILTRLLVALHAIFKERNCEVYPAPFDVRLSAAAKDEEEFQVVQPDISVICDNKKLDERGCKGAPELIVEVLSPSTWKRDRIEKLNLYQKYGVNEYVLIYPNEKIVEQYQLNENGQYELPVIFNENDYFTSAIFPESVKISLDTIFQR
ncbi:Uma2 family endonuclease [Neobacillus sp. SM06]|uniref:Uma2 family endonuclease n=1 Tax=Neobacillus sp. SM06 TaxID=3422492 RepID=UPI003D2AFD4A